MARSTATTFLCMVASLCLATGPAQGQSNAAAQSFRAMDSTGLGGPHGTMQTVLERTFLRVDVLSVEVRVDADAAARIASVVQASGTMTAAGRDSVAAAALDAREAWARLEYLRGTGIDRVLDEIRKSMLKAVEAGVMARVQYDSIATRLPEWYAPLRARGVKDGDQQFYRLRGDTVRTVYIGRDGQTYIELESVGRAHRLALLGSWFARGSEFRDGLIRSLMRR